MKPLMIEGELWMRGAGACDDRPHLVINGTDLLLHLARALESAGELPDRYRSSDDSCSFGLMRITIESLEDGE